MYVSVFDLFKIGPGPSSSHAVGPIKASLDFIEKFKKTGKIGELYTIKLDLYGSFALTMWGHNTHIAFQIGLMGYRSDEADPDTFPDLIEKIKNSGKLNFNREKMIDFDEKINIICHKTEELPHHSNGFIISALDSDNKILFSEEYYSIGGGFIKTKAQMVDGREETPPKVPYLFSSWCELKAICVKEKKEVWDIISENEKAIKSEKEIDEKLTAIYNVMLSAIDRSLNRKQEMPGNLGVRRRSVNLAKKINHNDPLSVIEKILLWGLAVAEENATFGQVVTAPTNGSAGVIPGVIKFMKEYHNLDFELYKKFMFVASAVGMLCKINASISGAGGGCQAEIGSAVTMAAAGLTAVMGGNTDQCENAAIIALTHNLGLTCDSVGGLVQIPCIERNAVNAVAAVAAARLAILEDRSGYLTLDMVIRTMKQTGDDMNPIYKETSLGGLAKFAVRAKTTGGDHSNCNLCS
ncbi:MAG: L-serine ammonia-lyase [Rickettsiales bacterium]|jgi:L-serine dehydratase|nr:L-serine ammonia-lyase [Rickettsiales bacterium]